MLVAHDGEWTRRRVPSVEWAHRFANQHGVPSYDAAVVGYPATDAGVQPPHEAERRRLTRSADPRRPTPRRTCGKCSDTVTERDPGVTEKHPMSEEGGQAESSVASSTRVATATAGAAAGHVTVAAPGC